MGITSKRTATFEEMQGEYPAILYKYRSWRDSNHKKIITERQVYLSPPSGFEDIKDCKSLVRYDLLSEKEKLQWIEFKLKQEKYGLTRQLYRAKAREIYKQSPMSNSKEVKKLQEDTFEEYDKRIGVLSLTGNPNNDKMWEKYGDNEKGFCIGFNPLILFHHLGGGGRVVYVKELPKVMPEPIHSHDEQMVYQLYYKEDIWDFEDEYRTHTFNITPLSKNDRVKPISSSAFIEIILGKNMSDEDKKELVNSIPDELSHLKIIER